MKKSRLLEIIREEISAALNEVPLISLNPENPESRKKFDKTYQELLDKMKEGKKMDLRILLAILNKDGEVDTNALSDPDGSALGKKYKERLAAGYYPEVGEYKLEKKGTATYWNGPYRILFNTTKGKDATADWSDKFQFEKGVIIDTSNARGRKAGEDPKEKEKGEKKSEPKAKKEEKPKSEPKSKKEEKSKSEPKAKKEEEESDEEIAALEKAEKEFYSPEEEETSTVQEPSKKELEKTDKELKDKTQVPKEIVTQIEDVIAKKKAKLKAAQNNPVEFQKQLTALKQWLNGKEIKKAINILGKETYDINTILKDIK